MKKMITEEHRPSSLREVIGQPHIVNPLIQMIEGLPHDDIPHLAFYGKHGTGKTSTAIAFMKDAFGDNWDSNFLELNASDERSIGVIRTKVKDFAKRGTIGTFTAKDGKTYPIPFNVVFLDECDNLTPDAQSALRRLMEKHKQTRFILSANYPHKIIQPIHDRCAFSSTRFRPISPMMMLDYLDEKVDTEKRISNATLTVIAVNSNGSVRKALNLYDIFRRFKPDSVTPEDVREYLGTVNKSVIRSLMTKSIMAVKKDEPRLWRTVDAEIDKLAGRGLTGYDILNEMIQYTSEDNDMPTKLRNRIFSLIGDALHWVSVSQDDMLAVKAFLRRFSLE